MTEELKLYRCMGGPRCSHIPGSCTATNSEYQAKAKARAHPPAAPTDALVKALNGYLSDCTNDECERCQNARAAIAAMQEAKP